MVRGGREVQEGGDIYTYISIIYLYIYTHMADSLHRMAGTNTTL